MTAKEILKNIETGLGDITELAQGANDKQYFLLVKDKGNVRNVIKYLFKDLVGRLNIMTGIEGRDHVEVLYHMSWDRVGLICTVKVFVDKPFPTVDTVSDIVIGSKWIEREIYELFDVKFKGHPELIPLLRSDTRPADYFPYQREVKDTHETIRMKEDRMKEK
jgi:NADH:ubiquinone oxidoreductase subunit C